MTTKKEVEAKLVIATCKVLDALSEQERKEEFKRMLHGKRSTKAFNKKFRDLSAQTPKDFFI